MGKRPFEPARLDGLIVILIALASLFTALTAWRTNAVSSLAANASRAGLIDAVKQSAAAGENWRLAYQEAGYARDHRVESAAAAALAAGGDAAGARAASNLQALLLPSLAGLAGPLGSSADLERPDGTLAVEQRFAALQAETPDLSALDPEASFAQAARYHREQRWLTVGTVLLAICLFWLALAEINGGMVRVVALIIGAGLLLVTLPYLLVVEAAFVLLGGGAG